MATKNEAEIWDTFQCTKCGRYVDRETGRIVRKPEHGRVMSHTLCDDCAVEELARRREMLRQKQETESAITHGSMMGDRAIRYCIIRARLERGLGLEPVGF